jgi:hypothetical protein
LVECTSSQASQFPIDQDQKNTRQQHRAPSIIAKSEEKRKGKERKEQEKANDYFGASVEAAGAATITAGAVVVEVGLTSFS